MNSPGRLIHNARFISMKTWLEQIILILLLILTMILYSTKGEPHCSLSSISIILIPYGEKKEKSKCHLS